MKCPNCGKEVLYDKVLHGKLGFTATCPHCNVVFDPNEILRRG